MTVRPRPSPSTFGFCEQSGGRTSRTGPLGALAVRRSCRAPRAARSSDGAHDGRRRGVGRRGRCDRCRARSHRSGVPRFDHAVPRVRVPCGRHPHTARPDTARPHAGRPTLRRRSDPARCAQRPAATPPSVDAARGRRHRPPIVLVAVGERRLGVGRHHDRHAIPPLTQRPPRRPHGRVLDQRTRRPARATSSGSRSTRAHAGDDSPSCCSTTR